MSLSNFRNKAYCTLVFSLIFFFALQIRVIAQSAHNIEVKKKYTYQLKRFGFRKWGYDILINERVLIHQDRIPGITGLNAFNRKSKAKKTALLVIEKLEMGQLPPSISIEELKKLKVLP